MRKQQVQLGLSFLERVHLSQVSLCWQKGAGPRRTGCLHERPPPRHQSVLSLPGTSTFSPNNSSLRTLAQQDHNVSGQLCLYGPNSNTGKCGCSLHLPCSSIAGLSLCILCLRLKDSCILRGVGKIELCCSLSIWAAM